VRALKIQEVSWDSLANDDIIYLKVKAKTISWLGPYRVVNVSTHTLVGLFRDVNYSFSTKVCSPGIVGVGILDGAPLFVLMSQYFANFLYKLSLRIHRLADWVKRVSIRYYRNSGL